MMLRDSLLVLVSVVALAACTEQHREGSVGQPKPVAEDERGSVGPGSPAAIYCEKVGYRTSGGDCVFPDGTTCEQWSFYNAKCGEEHSYCSLHGGTIASLEADAGGFTTVTAICTVNGVQCLEQDFFTKAKCGP